jgi:hypothetical protein
MPITKDPSRQSVKAAVVDFDFADFASGVGEIAIAMPAGSILVGGELVIDTVFNSSVSDTLTVGDAGSATRYKSGINGQALGRTALVPTGYVAQSATGDLKITWTGVGDAPTTGAGRLLAQYIVPGSAEFVQR